MASDDEMQAAIGDGPDDAVEPVPRAGIREPLRRIRSRGGIAEQRAAPARARNDVPQLRFLRGLEAQGHVPPPCGEWPSMARPPFGRPAGFPPIIRIM